MPLAAGGGAGRRVQVRLRGWLAVEEFAAPRIGISKVYTRTGDGGETGLVGGQRVRKDSLRIEAYGTLDELNAWLGLCRVEALAAAGGLPPGAAPPAEGSLHKLAAQLLKVQHQVFNAGSVLATLPQDVGPRQPRVRDEDTAALEAAIDEATARLPALRSFVLPGGSRLNALLHGARTVCRRAERLTVALQREAGGCEREVRYLNRLSDALFVWSRLASQAAGGGEVLWDPNQG